MARITAEREIDVVCGGCGKPLDTHINRYGELVVDPCTTCMDEKFEDGRLAAKDDA